MKARHLIGLGAAACLFGCVTVAEPVPVNSAPIQLLEREPEGPTPRQRVVELARELVGKSRIEIGNRRYQSDCTGLVKGVFDQLGISVGSVGHAGDNGVTAIHRFAERYGRLYTGGRPLPGDLVFFRNTYDRDRDGRFNDGLTHIGLVEDVDADGTVTVIHRIPKGVVRYRMNLAHPRERLDPVTGEPLNDYLRPRTPSEPPVLTAQLFAGYATLLPLD